jgi:hypothetical protein
MGCKTHNFKYCHQSHPNRSYIFDELSDTYSLLFRAYKDRHKENIAQYGLLNAPQWLRVFYGDENGSLPIQKAANMFFLIRSKKPKVSDIKYHLKDLKNPLPPTMEFERFKIWQSRLRKLTVYMDSQKPRGLRGLWMDKRDGAQWFTFRAVLIIGGVGHLLSVLALAVSIVQTVGTFRGLRL